MNNPNPFDPEEEGLNDIEELIIYGTPIPEAEHSSIAENESKFQSVLKKVGVIFRRKLS